MKRTLLLSTLFCSLALFTFAKDSGPKLKKLQVKAPFGTVKIAVPDFNQCKRFSITDFGAVKGDKEKTSVAIAAAIAKANENGGGVVVIPEGEWLTKKIHFKSNVALHLAKGAVLLFSEDPADYLPAVRSTWEGLECYNYSPLIYAYQCRNVAITGEGELKAKMDVWKCSSPTRGHTWKASSGFITSLEPHAGAGTQYGLSQ